MGKRGPAPVPTALLALRDSWLAKKRKQAGELEAPVGLPTPPFPLDEIGEMAWEDLIGLMAEMGHLSTIDGFALAKLCETYSQWLSCVLAIREQGVSFEIETKDNGTHRKEHPLFSRCCTLSGLLDKQFAKFGLTPSDRVGMPAAKPSKKPDDPMGDFKL